MKEQTEVHYPINKFFYTLAMATIIMTTASILLVTYWLVYPYEDILTQESKLDTVLKEHTVKSGGYLQLENKFCKNRSITATVTRTFVDGITYTAPPFISDKAVGCYDEIEYVYVPKALPTGVMKMQTTYSYKVNPIRTIEHTFVTEQFTVTK